MQPRDALSTRLPPPAPTAGPDRDDILPAPAVRVAASELFCHPSRLANCYEPGIERIHQHELVIPAEALRLSVRRGWAPAYGRQVPLAWRGRLTAWLEAFGRGPRIDLKERLVYDARPVFNGNMAHLVQHHLASLGYVKARLGHGPGEVLVVLEKEAPALALRVFSLLGYEVLTTHLPVRGNLIDLAPAHFFHLLPYVRHLDLPAWTAGVPQRVFVPRRGSRRLANQAEVAACLAARGFETVYFEDISIQEQWSVLGGATQVVAIHGAALGCLAFQAARTDGRRARLVELFGPGFVVNPFRKFMAVLGGRWAGCRGRITPAVARDIDRPGQAKAHAFDDFELAAPAVEAALDFVAGDAP